MNITKPCKLIPVVDLHNGYVVRATGGHRERYKPIKTSSFLPNDILGIIDLLLKESKSNIFYVANINGILGDETFDEVLFDIFWHFKNKEIWFDSGFVSLKQLVSFREKFFSWLKKKNNLVLKNYLSTHHHPVIGTESIKDIDELKNVLSVFQAAILSIDKKNNKIMGNCSIESLCKCWPSRVILMSIDRVGMGIGPDIDWLRYMKKKSKNVEFYGAGGLGSLRDLNIISNEGASGWLVSSAIHQSIGVNIND